MYPRDVLGNILTEKLRKNFNHRDLWAAGMISAATTFLLFGYEFIRSPSNTLFQASYGAENLPVVMAVMPIGTLILIYLYGWTLGRTGPRRTLWISSVFSAIFIAAGYLAFVKGFKLASAFLYIYREAYIVLIIEQYWSFLNSTLRESSAKKLNGMIIGMSSVGAVIGGMTVHSLSQKIGTPALLLIAAISLIPAGFFSDIAYRKCGEPANPGAKMKSKGGIKDHLGSSEIKGNPVLISLFALIILAQVVSTVLTLSFQTYLQQSIPGLDAQTAFSGKFYATLNGLSAILQFIGAPLLLSFLSPLTVQLCIPVIHLVSCSALVFAPSLQTAGMALLLFKAFDYSLFRVTKEILYMPLSFDARYRAKELIDVFGYRFSKGGTSLLVILLQRMGWAAGMIYPIMSLMAAFLWLALLLPVARAHRSESDTVPDGQPQPT